MARAEGKAFLLGALALAVQGASAQGSTYHVVNEWDGSSLGTSVWKGTPQAGALLGTWWEGIGSENEGQDTFYALKAITSDRFNGTGYDDAAIVFGDPSASDHTRTYSGASLLYPFDIEAATRISGRAVFDRYTTDHAIFNYSDGLSFQAGSTVIEAEIIQPFGIPIEACLDASVTISGGTVVSEGSVGLAAYDNAELTISGGNHQIIALISGLAAFGNSTVTVSGGTLGVLAPCGMGATDDASLIIDDGAFRTANADAVSALLGLWGDLNGGPYGIHYEAAEISALSGHLQALQEHLPAAWLTAGSSDTSTSCAPAVTVNGGTFTGGIAGFAPLSLLFGILNGDYDGILYWDHYDTTHATVTFNGGTFDNAINIVSLSPYDDIILGAPAFACNPRGANILLGANAAVSVNGMFTGAAPLSVKVDVDGNVHAAIQNLELDLGLTLLAGILDPASGLAESLPSAVETALSRIGPFGPNGQVVVRGGAPWQAAFTHAERPPVVPAGLTFEQANGDLIYDCGNVTQFYTHDSILYAVVEQTPGLPYVLPPDPTYAGHTFVEWQDTRDGFPVPGVFTALSATIFGPVFAPNTDYWSDAGNRDPDWPLYTGDGMDPSGNLCFDGAATYFIHHPSQLGAFCAMVNNGNTFIGKTVNVTRDLAMYGHDWRPAGDGMGNDAQNSLPFNMFQGTFDGGNHAIRGISLSYINEIDDYGNRVVYYALFGIVDGGTVRNVRLEDCLAAGVSFQNAPNVCVGGIAGYLGESPSVGNASVENCSVEGLFVLNFESGCDCLLGGIVAAVVQGGSLNDCHNRSIVYAINAVANSHIGGVAGAAAGNIRNCSNTGHIYLSSDSPSSTAGGLVGFMFGDTLVNSWTSGAIDVSGGAGASGAAVGKLGPFSCVVQNCYSSTKHVNGANTFIGSVDPLSRVENCYWYGYGNNPGDVDPNTCFAFDAAPGRLDNGDWLLAALNTWVNDQGGTSNGYRAWTTRGSFTLGAKGFPVFAESYTVTLDFGNAGNTPTESVRVSCGAPMPAIDVLPSYASEIFAGYTNEYGVLYYDADGGSARNWDKASDGTLYAVTVASDYGLVFYANGGVFGGSAEIMTGAAQWDNASSAYVYAMPLFAPVRDGHTFAGWNTAADGNGDPVLEGDAFTLGTSPQFLYAQWTPSGGGTTPHSEMGRVTALEVSPATGDVLLTWDSADLLTRFADITAYTILISTDLATWTPYVENQDTAVVLVTRSFPATAHVSKAAAGLPDTAFFKVQAVGTAQ